MEERGRANQNGDNVMEERGRANQNGEVTSPSQMPLPCPHQARTVHDDIFWLEVSMDEPLAVQRCDCHENLLQHLANPRTEKEGKEKNDRQANNGKATPEREGGREGGRTTTFGIGRMLVSGMV